MMNSQTNNIDTQMEERIYNKMRCIYQKLRTNIEKSEAVRSLVQDRSHLSKILEEDFYIAKLAMDAILEVLRNEGVEDVPREWVIIEKVKHLMKGLVEELEAKRVAKRVADEIRQRLLEEQQRVEKRMKKHLNKLRKEGERIAKMTDEEIVTAKVMADLENDRLKKIQEQKDIAFANQFVEKVKVQSTKTKKEKKRGNPYQKMLTISREAGIKTINPDWVKWENENK